MLDFSFYRTHARMVAMEAAGLPSFLRDEHGEVMRLCNDGNVYCNITTFDWTQPHVRELWVEQVVNITQTGLADGVATRFSTRILSSFIIIYSSTFQFVPCPTTAYYTF